MGYLDSGKTPIDVDPGTFTDDPRWSTHFTTTPTDGTYLKDKTNGLVYVVAGGTPLYVRGELGYLDSGKTVVDVDPGTFTDDPRWSTHFTTTPTDGTYLKDKTNGLVYVVAGGTPLYVRGELGYLDSGKTVVDVDPGTFTDDPRWSTHFTTTPTDGTYLKDKTNGLVYVVAGGTPLYVRGELGYLDSGKTVVDVDPGTFTDDPRWSTHFTTTPTDGTYLKDAASGDLYVVAGGAPIYISTANNIGGPISPVPVDPATVADAGTGIWTHLSYLPADGTYLRGYTTGKLYLVSGGVPTLVNSTSSTYVDVDQAAIDNAGTGGIWNHLHAATPTNTAPAARNDSVTTTGGTPLSIAITTLLANDSDVDGDKLSITTISTPGHGTTSRSGDTITYNPVAGYSGSDAFTYTVSDGNGGTAIATVSITITPAAGGGGGTGGNSANSPQELAAEARNASINKSVGWIPVVGTVFNAINLLGDFVQLTTALIHGSQADIADEINDMTIDVVGLIPIIGGPLAAQLYGHSVPAQTTTANQNI
ncbi:hypothetical protein BOH72_01430 [Mycobacterium sp. WY10]|nr:hypothetical protein BOH72_01430 [Mycobacterium sp. WY10]